MDLFENDIDQEKVKNKKIARIIIAIIVCLSIIVIALLVYITMLQSKQLKTTLDGALINLSDGTLIFEDTGKVYVSIKDAAKLFGYEYLNGEYGKISEDNTKGYVRNQDEIAVFETNSKKVYKLLTSADQDYNYFYIDENLKYIDGKLYTTPEGIKTIFNVTFNYNQETNRITIFTLPYLTTYYTTKVAEYGYKELVPEFTNRKSLVSDMIIAKKEDGKIGVISTTGEQIIGPKYDAITYIETTKDFFVKSNAKMGLTSNTGKTKIELLYDKIQLLDKDTNLYLVENDKKQGVLDKNGDRIIHLEYEKIGIDPTLYKNNDIKNAYLLFDNCIPVMLDKKWGIFDIKGNQILPVEYDSIGCVLGTSATKSTNNVVIIPDYEGIVVSKDKLFGIYNSTGKKLVEIALTSVYSITSGGKTTYEMEYDGQRLNIEEYFTSQGIKKVNKDIANSSDDVDNVNITSQGNTSINNVATNENTPINNVVE